MQFDRFHAPGAPAHRKLEAPALILIAMTWLAACAAGAGTSEPSPSRERDETPTPSPRPSFALASPKPSTGAGSSEQLSGALGADTVEGGCAYLEAPDGTRYEVIYPPGWRVSASPLSLTSPTGDVVATGGETITVRGRTTTEI